MNENNMLPADGGSLFPHERTTLDHTGASLMDFFAANAPTEIPEWFKSPGSNKRDGLQPHEIEEMELMSRYFLWRWYYAHMMIQAKGKA